MEHKEKVKAMMLGIKLDCPYCGMGVSRISTSESTTAICGWCDIKWKMKGNRVTEEEEKRAKIIHLEID